jgi:hypothetical protein
MNPKLKRKDGTSANQLRKAIATAVINLAQGLRAHICISLPMRQVTPADAHAALRITDPVIYRKHQGEKWISFREKEKCTWSSGKSYLHTLLI